MTDKHEQNNILPEMLAAAGVAMIYCYRQEIWPDFSQWATRGHPETIPGGRESLREMVMLLDGIIKEVETEIFSVELADFLSTLNKE